MSDFKAKHKLSATQLSNADKLSEFHEAIGLVVPTRPTVPDLTTLRLRYTLIQEEFTEVQSEFKQLQLKLETNNQIPTTDLAPLVHELADLLYVTYGALNLLGLDTNQVFAKIHQANMHKTTGPKRADGKQLKPDDWQPADIQALLDM